MRKRNLLLFALFLILSSYSYAQEIVNGGFEMLGQKSAARNWMFEGGKSSYKLQIDPNDRHSGKYALLLTDTSLTNYGKIEEAIVANTFGGSSLNKVFTIELQAWVKYSNAKDSTIALFIQNQRGDKIIRSFVKTSKQAGQKWQKIQLNFKAEKDIPWYGFYYGFEISAEGKIWMDDVEIKVNGEKVADAAGYQFEPTAKNISWLNANLYPLKSKYPDNSHGDLEPIGKLIADSRIVALGEPTHGTHEAFTFKLNAIKYLVLNKGFTTIALEEVIPTCDIMNEVVNTNSQAIKDSLISLPFYKIWKTAELTELLEWVSSYNRDNPTKKVNFTGMDMEDIRIKTSRNLLSEYGKLYSQPLYTQIRIIDNDLEDLMKVSNKGGQKAQVLLAAEKLKSDFRNISLLLENEPKLINNKALMFRLQTYLRVCEQWLATRFYGADRDKFLAENVKFYTENFPEHKLLIWAHNFHVANQPTEQAKTMGAHLKDLFNKDYVSIGFTSAQGTYTAAQDYSQKKWSIFTFEKAYKGTYEYVLAKADRPFYFLPLNQKGIHLQKANWLNIPMKHLDNGYIQADRDDDYKFYGNLNQVFDGIVFCKETTASNSYLIR